MKVRHWFVGAAASSLLGACGGGSGGVGSTPPPAPAPTPSPTPTPTPSPAPTNTTLTDLQYSQSFANEATSLSGTWDTTTGTGIEDSAERSRLTISYDAGSGSYTVSVGGRSGTFGSADIAFEDDYDRVYEKVSETGSDYLTLVKMPYSGGTQPQYVAMGFWQHSEITGSLQSTEFATFTYGLPTAAAAVPRSGMAAYGIDVFGLVSAPGEEPASFQGQGQFSVDFMEGIFTTEAYVEEYGLVTGKTASGGGIELRAGGNLSSTGGTFAGNAVYGSYYGQSSGTIEGRFYGPVGEELGATFETSNSGGLSAVGSLVGQRDASLVAENQTLTNLIREQSFLTYYGENATGHLVWLNSETFDFGPYSSDMGGGRFTINDKVAGDDPNFTVYEKFVESVYGDQDVTLKLYKPGAANAELALTYASFGHWAGIRDGMTQDAFFTYGFNTGDNFLAARTGSARYEGVAYGSGIKSDGSAQYDVKGSSLFNVDFTSQTFDGALALAGTERTSGEGVNFGSFDIDGSIAARGSNLMGDISRSGVRVGDLFAQFYGPDAEELAGTFWVNVPPGADGRGVGVQGATAATRK